MLHCKGLPESFKPFVVVVTQSDKEQTFTEFKAALKTLNDLPHTAQGLVK